MIFMTDWHGSTYCSIIIGGARLMHGPFSKILGGGAPPPDPPRIDAPEYKWNNLFRTSVKCWRFKMSKSILGLWDGKSRRYRMISCVSFICTQCLVLSSSLACWCHCIGRWMHYLTYQLWLGLYGIHRARQTLMTLSSVILVTSSLYDTIRYDRRV